jgi:hypothetical protein
MIQEDFLHTLDVKARLIFIYSHNLTPNLNLNLLFTMKNGD